MEVNPIQFINPEPELCDPQTAAAVILPLPYEGGVSYGTGTAGAPDAVLKASHYLETYDEILKGEPYRMGIVTAAPPELPADDHQRAYEVIHEAAAERVRSGRFVAMIGGDHSVSSGFFKALVEHHGALSAIQIDAHADLRDSFEGSPLSHACVMSRIRELTPHTLQFGIRSMSAEEADRIEKERIPVCTMDAFRNGGFDVDGALARLPDPVFLTVDVDAFDWSVIWSTGTPEPGGFQWDEALGLIHRIFLEKTVVGFDVVELSCAETDRNSPFAVAKLIYKMLGYRLEAEVTRGRMKWPEGPRGKLF